MLGDKLCSVEDLDNLGEAFLAEVEAVHLRDHHQGAVTIATYRAFGRDGGILRTFRHASFIGQGKSAAISSRGSIQIYGHDPVCKARTVDGEEGGLHVYIRPLGELRVALAMMGCARSGS